MTQQIILKRSSVAAKVPLTTDLVLGELAVNTNDGTIFMKKNNGVDSIVQIGGVSSVAGKTGTVTLVNADISGSAPSASPVLTGTPTTTTPTTGDNSLNIASTAFVKNQNYITSTGAPVQSVFGRTGSVVLSSSDVTTALTFTPANQALVGANSGIATLNSSGQLTTAQIPSSLVGAVVYQGTWNATTNTPTLASGVGTKGWYYKVSVVGSTAIDGNSQWNLGDTIIFDGTVWDKIDGISSEVVSVFGRTGAVVMTNTDVNAALTTLDGGSY